MSLWVCPDCNISMNAIRRSKHKCLTDKDISNMIAVHTKNSAEDAGIRLRQRGKNKKTLSKYTVRHKD